MPDKLHYKIGYALTEKKRQSFLLPSLVEFAQSRGIDLVAIDSTTPLLDQGPFDAILHKLHDKQWIDQLKEYCEKYPHVMVIDPPEAIEKVHNRISMLQGVEKLKITEGNETVAVPVQIVVEKPEELTNSEILEELKFPVIAKPLVADGSAISHSMSLVFNSKGLKSLKPPLVLQEFVNHSGVIFKVYVVGDFVECVKRKSLRDVSHEEMQSSVEGLILFSQISNTAAENYDEGTEIEQAELPPAKFIEDLARGYAKMPAYEAVLTNFFWNLFHEKHETSGKEVALGGEEIENKIPVGE
ncbi:hypothetical protein SUGI_1162700 [Cryptomeria japonica]|nr:hypothetical protein SUGI_1162700 [Cryptomeria japonica]